MEARIKEIFESIQGEGPVVGYKQLFIRFCGCNLDCEYCDTDFDINSEELYSPKDLAKKINSCFELSKIHSISFTGGEPLLNADFINEFANILPEIRIYLETNATLPEQLIKIKDKIDIISADIKLPSAAGKDTFELHDRFLQSCAGVYTFAKIVFDSNITESEIEKCCQLGQKYGIELILQPKMDENNLSVNNDFCEKIMNKFLNLYPSVRLIPQVHKFLNLR